MEISDTHVLPVIFLLPHPVVLVVHPLVANLAVRLQGGLLLVAHVDHTHAPVGGKEKKKNRQEDRWRAGMIKKMSPYDVL